MESDYSEVLTLLSSWAHLHPLLICVAMRVCEGLLMSARVHMDVCSLELKHQLADHVHMYTH